MIDTVLDRSVVLGYGSTGYAVCRRLPGWPADPPRMDGEVVLVPGAASGMADQPVMIGRTLPWLDSGGEGNGRG